MSGTLLLASVCILQQVLLRVDGLAAGTEASRASAAAAAEVSASREIPPWRLDGVYDPAQLSRGESKSQVTGAMAEPTGSTPGQDRQVCPIIKLPADLNLACDGSHWHKQWGNWEGTQFIRIANWRQGVFMGGGGNAAVHVADFDGREAVKVLWTDEVELRNKYGWTLDPAETAPQGPGTVAALVDCAGFLLSVFLLREKGYVQGEPGGINIYDRTGSLLAHTLEDYTIPKMQFVDGNGYLLATSQAPGINSSLLRQFLEPDPSKGNILPFGLHFEVGGYPNASRLIDVDYRYVIATAVQSRALYEASPGSFSNGGLTGKPLPNVLRVGSGGLSGTVGFRPGDLFNISSSDDDVVFSDPHVAAISNAAQGNLSGAQVVRGAGYMMNSPNQLAITSGLSLLTACFLFSMLFCCGQLMHGIVYPSSEEGGSILAPGNPFIMWAPGARPAEKRRLMASAGFAYSSTPS